MFKSTLRVAAFAAANTAALMISGQAAQAQVPVGAGGLLQQIPPVPLNEKSPADLQLDRKSPTEIPAAGGPKALVRSLRVTGATLFSERDLVAASTFRPNTELDLAGLKTLAANITGYYNSRGYFLAQAYLPEQDLQSGTVTITVLEGRFGAVGVKNESRLSDRVANGILSGLDVGDPVAVAPLERRLLILSDVPGVRVRSTLSPGTAVGTSDLLVDITPGESITGSVEADNAGSRYTGAYRVGGTVNWNNPTGSGDVLSLRALTSFSGLAYGRASYQAPIGKVTLGVAYAHLDYSLGKEFDSLDASGNADVASVYASYPLIRSRANNLYFTVGGDMKWFEDKIGVVDTVSYRRAQVLNIGLSGDEHDTVLGGGWSAYSLSYSVGNLDIRGAFERSVDAQTARTDGRYGKVQFSIARLQTIAGPLSLFASARGQIAFDNLDISEKMELGGAYAVRAYPEGEAYGDQGYVATAEARVALPQILPGSLQLFGFVDVGEVDYVKHPYFDGSNHATRSAYGGGLSWAGPYGIAAKATYARKLGSADATSAPDKSGRAWFQLSKTF
ncbi:ShlB/FhaC/HecB family hemolysin secretion/activation protein [Sphingomonas sp. M1A8_2b]